MPLYPKLSNQAIVRSKGFDPDVPSPLGQAFTRRMTEQQQADIKAQDMKLSPLDRAVAGLESAMTMGSMMFEAIQQAPKLLQGEDAYAQAIGNRIYQPRMNPEKSYEYLGDVVDMLDKAQTEYKLPPILPEVAGFAPLMQTANRQVKQGVNKAATNAGMALERSLDKPVTNIMNRGGFGAQMLGSFDTQPAQVVKPRSVDSSISMDKQLNPDMPIPDNAGVHISDNPDTMAMELDDQKYQVGGIVDIAARAAKAAKAAQMKQAMKASEALAKIEGKRLNITQADRTKVGQGFLGGPGFSGLQHQEGPHKDVGAVWGVKNVGTAKTMLGGFQDPLGKEYFTTMIGSPTQHQSNQMVFDKLYNQFKSEAKKGNLDPELRDKINARLASSVDKDGKPIFPSDIDILDKNFKKQATTFDQRAVTGNVLGGVGVGGKKGQIFDYDKVIRDTTDPFLLDAPSGSMGYRLWTPSGEVIERPDLHPAFPAIATGEDLGVEFNPAAQDILMEPWVQNIRETKGRNPGYMDWTRGRPPSVEVTEDILTNLQKSGNKEGGLIKVKRKAGGGIMKKAIKAAEAVAPATKRLEMSFKDVAKPVPELTEAAQKLKAGKLSREEYEALVNKHKPVTPYSFVPQPATAEDATRALNSAKREKFGKTKEIPIGTPTGLRLDIPAYKDHGVWVNSVHADDMPTMYDNVSSVTNAEMVMPEDKALSVATREANKSPFAVIKGGWNPMSEEEAVAKATEYLNHPDWVQVGIDPERHGYYYNRATMEPIVKAEEVIQIGPLVLAKNPTTAPKEAFKYARGGAITGDDLILTERPL